MGRDGVAQELPGPAMARREGKPPWETVGDGQLSRAEEPWAYWGAGEKTVPPLLRPGENLRCRTVRAEDRGRDGSLIEGPGVFLPWPGILGIAVGGIKSRLLRAQV